MTLSQEEILNLYLCIKELNPEDFKLRQIQHRLEKEVFSSLSVEELENLEKEFKKRIDSVK
jgi:hypothetical protein